MRFIRTTLTLFASLFALLGTCGVTQAHITGTPQAQSDQQDHRQYAWKRGIVYLNPNRTPFLQLMSHIKTVPVKDFEYKVHERDFPHRWVRLNEALDTSETPVDVDDGTAFRADDVIIVGRTGEMMLVASISGNTLTVTRGYLGTTATAANDNDWVRILFSKEAEKDGAPGLITSGTTTITNFTQIFKRGWGLSGTRKAMTFTDDPHSLPEMRKLAMALMKEDMEGAYLWGRKAEINASNVYTRFTGGINQFVTTNRIDMDGGIGFGDIAYMMNVFTRFGGDKKVWLCGRDARQQIDGVGIEFRRVTGKASKMGFSVDGFKTSAGTAMVTTHLGLDNAYAGHMVVVDPAHARIAQLRKVFTKKHVETPGTDGEEHYMLGENGLWTDQELAHGIVYNITKKLV